MKVLVDTNVLLRSSQPAHPQHASAVAAVQTLTTSGHVLCISSQTIYEFLAVATRAISDRGLGMSQADADALLDSMLAAFDVLYDSPAVSSELRRLVVAHGVTGKSVHDTRLVAAMNVNGVGSLLTFNVRDFGRFSGIAVLDPQNTPGAPPTGQAASAGTP